MKVFMIGGTGLLGSEGARELIKRGHKVTALSLSQVPLGADIPKEMELKFGDFNKLSDKEIIKFIKGMDAVAFCAGIDERIVGDKPIYDMFYKYNNAPVERLLTLAKTCGVKKALILGSYFTYFERTWPELELYKKHPYIRSRVDQEKLALSFADDKFQVSVLELPYIFGIQNGRKPVWVFMVEIIKKMPFAIYFCKGGTAMVTIKQVGQCIAGALEQNNGSKAYPIGFYNKSWKELYKLFAKYMGEPKPFITIPKFMFKCFSKKQAKQATKLGKETGLNYELLDEIMTRNAFIEPEISKLLTASEDDINLAIKDSVELSNKILKDKTLKIVEMRKE
ncbi:MAG: NAD(P)-dependent oxidoreductase [Clostridia bacterium]